MNKFKRQVLEELPDEEIFTYNYDRMVDEKEKEINKESNSNHSNSKQAKIKINKSEEKPPKLELESRTFSGTNLKGSNEKKSIWSKLKRGGKNIKIPSLDDIWNPNSKKFFEESPETLKKNKTRKFTISEPIRYKESETVSKIKKQQNSNSNSKPVENDPIYNNLKDIPQHIKQQTIQKMKSIQNIYKESEADQKQLEQNKEKESFLDRLYKDEKEISNQIAFRQSKKQITSQQNGIECSFFKVWKDKQYQVSGNCCILTLIEPVSKISISIFPAGTLFEKVIFYLSESTMKLIYNEEIEIRPIKIQLSML